MRAMASLSTCHKFPRERGHQHSIDLVPHGRVILGLGQHVHAGLAIRQSQCRICLSTRFISPRLVFCLSRWRDRTDPFGVLAVDVSLAYSPRLWLALYLDIGARLLESVEPGFVFSIASIGSRPRCS